jgi:PGF-pre-PGF domain-containing protein
MEQPRGLAAVTLCVVLVCAGAFAASGSVTADDEYEITVPGSVDTPTRTVDIQGKTYEISAIAKAEINSSIDVEVTAPDADSEYRLYLYNGDGKIVTTPGDGAGSPLYSGDTTATFDLTGVNAGTYALAAQEGNTNEVVHPLVIEAFDTSIDSAPGSATVGENITIDVSVDRDSDASGITKDRVEVVVANDSTELRTTATDNGDGYTAEIETGTLGAGSYNLYATVRGTEEVLGRDEVLGISDDQSLTLEAADDSESTDTSGGDGARGGGGDVAPAPSTATATPGATATPSQTATPENSTDLTIDDVSGTETISQTRANITVDSETGTSAVTFDDTAPVENIEFQPTDDSGTASVTGSVQVTEVSTPPAETGAPPGATTTIMEVQVPATVEDRSATVRFRVPAERLETTEATAETLRVYRYADDEWQRLDARVVAGSGSRVTIEAETPGFSFFSTSAVGSPTAEMMISSTTVSATKLRLNASESTDPYGTIVAYEWTVAGQTLTGEAATLTIEESGEYTVELTVTNGAGEMDTVTETVRITRPSGSTAQSAQASGDEQTTTATSNVISPETDESTESSRAVGLPIYIVLISILLGAGYVARWHQG